MADPTVIVVNNPVVDIINGPTPSVVIENAPTNVVISAPVSSVVIENTPTTVVLNTSVPSVIVSATQGPPGKTGDLVEGSFDSNRVNITSLGLQTLDSFPYTQFGAAKYIIYGTFGLERQVCEILLIQDGTTVQTVEYANMVTTSLLGSFSANITNGFVNIIVDPTTVGASFKIIRTLINN